MRKINKELNKEVLKTKKEIALYMVRYLIENTPVDTSAALSNWQIRIQGTARVIEAHNVGSRGSTRSFSSAVSVNIAKLQLADARLNLPIIIYNHIDYIGKLEERDHFVQTALIVGRQKLIGKRWLINLT